MQPTRNEGPLDQNDVGDEELTAFQARLPDILDQLPIGVGVIDRNGRFILSNEAMGRFVPYRVLPSRDRDRMSRWHTIDEQGNAVPPDQWPGARALRGQTVSPGMEFRFTGDDQDQHWILESAGPFRSGAGEIIGAIVVVQDITARKRTEEALREAEHRYRELVRCAPAGIYEIDFRQRRFTSVNDAMCEMLGYSREELLASDPRDVLDEEGRARFRDRVARWLAGEEPERNVEYRVRRKDGSTLDVILDTTFTRGEDGRPLGATVVGHDVTDRKRTEEALQYMNETLEQQVAERTAVAEQRARQLQGLALQLTEAEEQERRRIAELLHDDLQQLLSASRFHLSALQSAVSDRQDAVRMLQQVDQLLEQSIAKSRRLSHELSPAILHHSGLLAAIDWLSRQMRETQGLRVEVEAHGWVTLTNEALQVFLFRAVQEMLFNVVKHAGVKKAQVRLEALPNRLLVSVSDRGRGFDPGRLDEPDAQHKGFGLFSIRERLSYMGGDLHIATAAGQGSTLTLTIPLEGLGQMMAPAATEPVAEMPRTIGKIRKEAYATYRVLLADDHQVLRQGLIALLEGYPDIRVVGEAANGREAVEMAHQLKPDVILMDVVMPEMDGIEATRRITAELPGVRVIGLSMLADDEVAEQVKQAGAVAYLSKAGDSQALLETIRGRSV